LELNLPSGLPEIVGDRHRLEQVFLNIVLNAVDAMPEGGQLSISCTCADQSLVTTITDSGCGIPEEDQGRVFDPFYTTKEVGEGTGLGLSIAHGIVQEHGGQIEVRSQMGQGSEFIVHLPLHGPELSSTEATT
jgi:signal transduction histidine kinase